MGQDINTIVLRPRFKLELPYKNTRYLNAFIKMQSVQTQFVITLVDEHIFIKRPKNEQHFWSPQLHLEINDNIENNNSTLHGLFGPKPAVWTLFMFFHFVIAMLFIGLSVFTYTKFNLNKPIKVYVWLLALLTICWFALYLIGRLGKYSSKNEMHALYNFMESTVSSIT